MELRDGDIVLLFTHGRIEARRDSNEGVRLWIARAVAGNRPRRNFAGACW
jgi:hypothetical protein